MVEREEPSQRIIGELLIISVVLRAEASVRPELSLFVLELQDFISVFGKVANGFVVQRRHGGASCRSIRPYYSVEVDVKLPSSDMNFNSLAMPRVYSSPPRLSVA